MKKENYIMFFEPMAVMFYLFLIGILMIGKGNLYGIFPAFVGGFFGSFLLIDEIKKR